jgi:hypothetical protein
MEIENRPADWKTSSRWRLAYACFLLMLSSFVDPERVANIFYYGVMGCRAKDKHDKVESLFSRSEEKR